ncbi:MAG: hypothetical protein L3J54_12855, partial [Draconibacterium sp.]|nr:hypothetical protein [Draconibacterium sp.]
QSRAGELVLVMKSFRAERQRKHASTQLLITILVLLTSIVLVKYIPIGDDQGLPKSSQPSWETSVVKIP